MRRIVLIFSVLALVIALACTAGAATQASVLRTYCTVAADGSCQVTVSATLHLEQQIPDLTFPVPKDASSVTLNGSRVRTQTKDNYRLVDLSGTLGTMTGDISITISYNLSDVIVNTSDGHLQLQLPLMSGFGYPVQNMEFSVTLPGQVPEKPAFSSGYHKANIEKDLDVSVNGATVSGKALKALKDHETLVMTMTVSEDMFPRTHMELPDMDAMNVAMTVSAILALLYWLLFLRCAPPRRMLRAIPPEGCTAGELASVLHLKHADLTTMIFTWAQLGYILIHMDRQDRVTLHKRMEMGNERGSFERRIFGMLFGKRGSVDTTGERYLQLSRKVCKMPAAVQSYVHNRSGNPLVFRALAAAIGLFGGVSIGIVLSGGAALQWLLVGVLAILGGISGWLIQRWAYSLFFRDKRDVWMALGMSVLWIGLGVLAGMPGTGIWVAIAQLLAGLMAAFGGRRTDEGRQAMAHVLGLRRYLRGLSRGEVQRMVENDPDYFHNLAAYALAMGVDRQFARRFGKYRMAGCPWLTTGMDGHLTAAEWSSLMRRAATAMELRTRLSWREKLLDLLRSFRI